MAEAQTSNSYAERVSSAINEATAPLPVRAKPSKYASIDSLDRHHKVEALKDPTLPKNSIKSPYDGLAHYMHLWKSVAADADAHHLNAQQKAKVADSFYKKHLAPAYKAMNIDPMHPEIWQKAAYGTARNWNIEGAYDNSLFHNFKHGVLEGATEAATAGNKILNILGQATSFGDRLKAYVPEYMKASVDPHFRATPWHEQLTKIHNQVLQQQQQQEAKKPKDTIQVGKVRLHPQAGADALQFWADSYVDHTGVLNSATSFIGEQAAQLPIYVALGAMTKGIAGGLKTANLTKDLLKTPAGKRALTYLLAGTEGYAYGAATRKQGDPNQAWADMTGALVLNGIFHIGGKAAAKIVRSGETKALSVKLKDIASEEVKEKIAHKEATADLASKGLRRATKNEQHEDHIKDVRNNLYAGGIPLQKAIHEEALAHVASMESQKLTRAQVRAHQAKLMEEDPARWGPVLSASAYIRALLGDQKLSSIKPGSPEHEALSNKLSHLIIEASSSMNKDVVGQEVRFEAEAAENLKHPSAAHTVEYYKAQAILEISKDPAAAKMIKPEQIEAFAQKLYAKDLQQAAKTSEQVLGGAERLQKVVEAASKVPGSAPIRTRTRRSIDHYGQPSVSFKAAPDYIVRFKEHKAAAKAKGVSLGDFFKDMEPQDFVDDLTNHFYPKLLKTAGVFFEHQNTREGIQNPNFLAFMYNYVDQMPREFGEALEGHFADTLKAQKYMNGRTPTDLQLMYLAKATWNHMDNFLASGHWPTESNIFRSTREKLWQATTWERGLLVERGMAEQQSLRNAFASEPEALSAALKDHGAFNLKRLYEFDKGPKRRTIALKTASLDRIQELNEEFSSSYPEAGGIPF